MKLYTAVLILLLFANFVVAQKTTGAKEQPVPCNGNADDLPGRYTDHTNTKYAPSLKPTNAERTAMLKTLIAIEKTEEASRKNFTITGCVARVSFSTTTKAAGSYPQKGYEYQLGIYQNVCHVTEHIVKTVGEYRSVLRIDVNPDVAGCCLIPGGTGEFFMDKKSMNRYEIPVDAKEGPGYEKDRDNNPSRISRYISERMVLNNRSTAYKSSHQEFLKIINGDGYTENWMSGSQYDKPNPKGYKWIDRRYLITKPGIPLVIPVSRKKYLEDLLEYFEIEKANFYYSLDKQMKNLAGNTSETAKKRMVVLEADKATYPKLYEDKKAKVKELLASQKEEWLQKPAVIAAANTTYDAYKRLDDIGKFYDEEAEYRDALYILNPAYFTPNNGPITKPVLIEVAFRYELAEDRGFSQRLFENFTKNFDFDVLHKMLE